MVERVEMWGRYPESSPRGWIIPSARHQLPISAASVRHVILKERGKRKKKFIPKGMSEQRRSENDDRILPILWLLDRLDRPVHPDDADAQRTREAWDGGMLWHGRNGA